MNLLVRRNLFGLHVPESTSNYQMLSTGEQWNPSDLYKIDMPVALVEKQKAKAIKQAKKLLQREGLLPPDEPVAS